MRISDWSSDVCSSDLSRVTKLPDGAAIQINVWHEAVWIAADNSQDERKIIGSGTNHGIGRTTHTDVRLEFTRLGLWKDVGIIERLRVSSLPEIGCASCRERVCQYV